MTANQYIALLTRDQRQTLRRQRIRDPHLVLRIAMKGLIVGALVVGCILWAGR